MGVGVGRFGIRGFINKNSYNFYFIIKNLCNVSVLNCLFLVKLYYFLLM